MSFSKWNYTDQVLKFVGISEFEFESEDEPTPKCQSINHCHPKLLKHIYTDGPCKTEGYKCVQSLVTKNN